MSTLNRLFSESSNLAEYAERYASYISELMRRLDLPAIERVGRLLEEARDGGHTIFLIGNGGSAATASHFANDLALGPRVFGAESYRAISLADNTALMTAAGNDLGYETIFLEQLKTLLHQRDLVIAISASGNSPSVLKAVEYANELGAITIGLTGFDGGQLRHIVSEYLHVATPKGDYGPVEDLHLMLNHLITSYLVRLGCEKKSNRTLLYSAKRSAHALEPVSVQAGHVQRARSQIR
jgi:D-sedoheptulose 7-phosphate isomerase